MNCNYKNLEKLLFFFNYPTFSVESRSTFDPVCLDESILAV